uniref:Uncharacterized protein n=1 Tax=Arundo donax TaxID=35708 RepID=A0A0A8XWI9_ARUDO
MYLLRVNLEVFFVVLISNSLMLGHILRVNL